jgi:hypothetical protein
VCFVVRKTISEQECVILTTLYVAGAKNTDSWHAWLGNLHHAFPLDIPMVPSSALAVATNGECFSCIAFSLSETIHFGSLVFITDGFDSLSLSPRGCFRCYHHGLRPQWAPHPHRGP